MYSSMIILNYFQVWSCHRKQWCCSWYHPQLRGLRPNWKATCRSQSSSNASSQKAGVQGHGDSVEQGQSVKDVPRPIGNLSLQIISSGFKLVEGRQSLSRLSNKRILRPTIFINFIQSRNSKQAQACLLHSKGLRSQRCPHLQVFRLSSFWAFHLEPWILARFVSVLM